MNANDLVGVDLDLAVADCEGNGGYIDEKIGLVVLPPHQFWNAQDDIFSPSQSWEQGGEIIAREKIAIREAHGKWYAIMGADLGTMSQAAWEVFTYKGGRRYGVLSFQVDARQQRFEGDTPLVAAMRCYVASKPGNEVFLHRD